ncbi:MAG: MMPL family transporter [Bacteroidales bacterium]|nr:MMPL family transporter [Bacteroidales bacterium]
MMPHVNVNTDMTKYLPDDSHMKAGIDLINHEFDLSGQMGGSDIRVMATDLTPEEKVDFRVRLRKIPEVKSVSVQENGNHTLYELSVPKSVDQLALGKKIHKSHSKIDYVETSQDGTTLKISLLLSALAILFAILFAMCPSWLEPILFLISTGVAVVLNMGTNALLPNVSSTTNSLAAILQLVLSMDYSIILINRFRQERSNALTSLDAMQKAIGSASSSIFSSALTTIVGLMMLIFMKLKIGADIGMVLSKGVFFSLICNFTILPTLILYFERAINRSHKAVLKIPTNRLAHFSMQHRVPLAILFVIIFAGSYILHNQTPVIFRNSKVSNIEPYFPNKNPIILVYSNEDEHNVAALLDSIQAMPHVEAATSYPSLMLHEYTPSQMVNNVQGAANLLSSSNSEESSPVDNVDMLSEDVLRLIYYAAHTPNPDIALSFGEFADFILAQSKDPHSVIAAKMDDDMKLKMAALEEFRSMVSEEESIPTETTYDTIVIVTPADTATDEIIATHSVAETHHHEQEETREEEPASMQKHTPTAAAPTTIYYNPFTDTAQLHRVMGVAKMTATINMGVTAMGYDITLKESLIKFVYARAKQRKGGMTPLEFAHFITGDLLNHKTFGSQIKPEQKELILRIQALMDSTENASLGRPENPLKAHSAPPLPAKVHNYPATPETIASNHPEPSPQPEPPAASQSEPSYKTIVKVRPAPEEETDPLALFLEMLSPNKRYTAAQMAQNFASMGQGMTPGMIEMLYLYYGGLNLFNEEWTMNLHDIVGFMADTMMNDPRYASFLDDNMRSKFAGVQHTLNQNLTKFRTDEHSIALIITDLPIESEETYQFIHQISEMCTAALPHRYYSIGESVMLDEMKSGFAHEMLLVTILTILAIFIIVAITFKSMLIAAILVMTVMSGVFVNVAFSGLGDGCILYLVYLIVQSVLMGAAIDYGILFTNYYRERRLTQNIKTALRKTYKGTIHTILTSGLILILVPGAIGIFEQDPSIRAIGRAIFVGALATVLIVLFVLPGLIATCDRFITKRRKKNTQE